MRDSWRAAVIAIAALITWGVVLVALAAMG